MFRLTLVKLLVEATMTIELSNQIREALAGAGDQPPTVLDTETNIEYVLVRADLFARMQTIVDGATKRAGWDDPTLDEYERYRK